MQEKDEAKRAEVKKQFEEVELPHYFGKFDKIVGDNGGYLVGNQVSNQLL